MEVNGGLWWWVRKVNALPCRLKDKVVKIANDDPRRVIHSFKVGFALTLVSFFYFYQPIFQTFGVTAIWVVVTVVVVFEFHVGATLSKGINRGMATMFGGALGVGAHLLCSLHGRIAEPILLAIFIFVIASVSTFVRFFPKMKARYDYGVLIFILTFCLVYIPSFQQDNYDVIEMTKKRLSTVIIGGAICFIISILVCPVWAGLDLHRLICLNLDNLGNSLQGFGEDYFRTEDLQSKNDKSLILQAYKSALNSKASEVFLANFARWEPGHGRFKFRHPWEQYLKVGALTRQCAYRIDALNSYLDIEIQTPIKIPTEIQETCLEMSMEAGKALIELSSAITKMKHPESSAKSHILNTRNAIKSLESILKSGLWDKNNKDTMFTTIVPSATIASLLIDVVKCVDDIAESVYELASLAELKSICSSEKSKCGCDAEKIETTIDLSHDHVVVTLSELFMVDNIVSGNKNMCIDIAPIICANSKDVVVEV